MSSPSSRRMAMLLTACVSLAACASTYRPEDPNDEYGPGRDVARLIWHKQLVVQPLLSYRPQEWASGAIGPNGTVFIGSSARRFVAIDRGGRQLWHMDTDGTISSRPWYDDATGVVYFGADDGKMYAVDAHTGKLRWTYRTAGAIVQAPVYSNGVLLFVSSENRIYGVDARNGTWRWQYDREPPEGFTIQGHAGVCASDTMAYTGFSDGVVVALKPATGEVIWTQALGLDADRFVDADATPVLVGDLLLVASYASGVHALAAQTGSVRWRFPLPGAMSLAAGGGRIFATGAKAGIVALDYAGRQLWRQAMPDDLASAPLVVGPYLFVSGRDSGLFVALARDGHLQQYFNPQGGMAASPASRGDMLVALSNGGGVYAFTLP